MDLALQPPRLPETGPESQIMEKNPFESRPPQDPVRYRPTVGSRSVSALEELHPSRPPGFDATQRKQNCGIWIRFTSRDCGLDGLYFAWWHLSGAPSSACSPASMALGLENMGHLADGNVMCVCPITPKSSYRRSPTMLACLSWIPSIEIDMARWTSTTPN